MIWIHFFSSEIILEFIERENRLAIFLDLEPEIRDDSFRLEIFEAYLWLRSFLFLPLNSEKSLTTNPSRTQKWCLFLQNFRTTNWLSIEWAQKSILTH